MSYQVMYSFWSYTSNLHAELYDSTGTLVGSTITSGFVSLGHNQYGYLATIPDNHTGLFFVFDASNPSAGWTWPINPQADQTVDMIFNHELIEPTGAFTWSGATFMKLIVWFAALLKNKTLQTSTLTTLRNDADSADIATSTVGEASGTFTRGKWS
jgi:hypothetical protein